jgi:hypothetical protein
LDGVDRTGEIRDDAVAGAAEDPPMMGRDALVDDGAAGDQPAQRADLVLTHQPAVARNIGGEDRRQLADRLFSLAHHADETDPFAVRRANEALLLAAVPDRAARRIDTRAQRRFRDDPPIPHRTQQIILADNPLAVADHVL